MKINKSRNKDLAVGAFICVFMASIQLTLVVIFNIGLPVMVKLIVGLVLLSIFILFTSIYGGLKLRTYYIEKKQRQQEFMELLEKKFQRETNESKDNKMN